MALDGGDLIALAGVVVGIVIACTQWWFGRQRLRMEQTLDLLARLQEPEGRLARFRVTALLKKADDHGGFETLSDEDRAEISSVASIFGLAGLLIENKQIDEDTFIEAYGRSVAGNFKKLEKYYSWNLERHKGTYTLWSAFARLAVRVESKIDTTR